MSSPQMPVTTRKVFYIPGYDPIHPRRYRELFRKEGGAQAQISGYELALSPGPSGGRFGWHVEARMDGADVVADFEVLVWSDIVRDSMDQGIARTYLQLVYTAWTYIASGALFRLMRLRKGPVIAALYPVVFLLVQLVLAVVAGSVVVWAGKLALMPVLGLVGHMMALAAGLGVAYALLLWFKARDNKLFAYYLMHDYAYSAASKGANPPELEARMAEFTEEIAAALETDVDEVLVVGHSSGAHLGVSILADLIRAGHVTESGACLSFLTLGQVVPMVSFLPKAYRLREDLFLMAQQDHIPWVDVTAPGDGCAFALCDPVSVSTHPPQEKYWPLVISAAFTQTLSPERWAELKRRFFRLHFQYLCAFDRPGDYDYFQITAGPQTLGARYRDRTPSPSRIETTVNRFPERRP